jgi:surface antigen
MVPGRPGIRFGESEMSILRKSLSVAALALGVGLLSASPALAQRHGGGGGGSHGGGGFRDGGGFRGGGGYRDGGGFRGGGFNDHFRGGFGGFYGGFYPGFGFGYDAFDPYWFDLGSAPLYNPEAYVVAPPPAYYAPQPYYGPQAYGQSPQYYPPAQSGAGLPVDNSRGFYTWQLGVESGSCNRPYVQQIAANLTRATPASLQSGAVLGGIPVQRVIGGRIGPRLDITDQVCATEALEHTATGTPVRWQTESGIPVTFTVTRSEDREGSQTCRDYEATAQFGSHTDKVRNTACKSTDGSWRATR